MENEINEQDTSQTIPNPELEALKKQSDDYLKG